MTLEDLFQIRCRTGHNIDKHLPVLREYASQCQSVTEFGTDIGFSTCAFLAAKPDTLDCYDLVRTDDVWILERLAGRTRMRFHEKSTLTVQIEPTDLLFLDTDHTYEQVSQELNLHGHKARKFLVFHDIVSNPCIVPAIEEYVERFPCWKLELWSEEQSGLAIYRREGG